MAEPALAASMQDCAIWAGETGTAGLRLGESAEPVTAHEIMIFRCIINGFLIAGAALARIAKHRSIKGFSTSRRPGPLPWELPAPAGGGPMYHQQFGPTG